MMSPADAGQRLRVHLRHHQRHIGVHTELAGVVDDDAAGSGGARRMHGRHRGAGAEEADVPAGEVELVQALDGQHLLVAETDLLPGAAPGGQGGHFLDGELSLGEGLQHLAPDCPGGTDDRDPVAHHTVLPLRSAPMAARLATISDPAAREQGKEGRPDRRPLREWVPRASRPLAGSRGRAPGLSSLPLASTGLSADTAEAADDGVERRHWRRLRDATRARPSAGAFRPSAVDPP